MLHTQPLTGSARGVDSPPCYIPTYTYSFSDPCYLSLINTSTSHLVNNPARHPDLRGYPTSNSLGACPSSSHTHATRGQGRSRIPIPAPPQCCCSCNLRSAQEMFLALWRVCGMGPQPLHTSLHLNLEVPLASSNFMVSVVGRWTDIDIFGVGVIIVHIRMPPCPR